MRLNFKRLALLGGKPARTLARIADLTSARVDLLVLTLRRTPNQHMLAKLLAVTDGVVSRLVSALEALGLVRRVVPDYDRRQRLIHLTEEGRRRLVSLEEWVPDDGSRGAQCIGEAALCKDWRAPFASYGLDFDPLERSDHPPMESLWIRTQGNPYRWLFLDPKRPPRRLGWGLDGMPEPLRAAPLYE